MKKIYSLVLALVIGASAFSQGCHKLFFSEYVEGGNSRKAVEIYNPTSSAISLFGYKVSVFANGSNSPSGSFNLNATLAAGDVYVIAYSQADSLFKLLGDTVSGALSFNGNDAVALLYGSDTIDVVGIIGNDPGTNNGWVVDTAKTINHTLIRKSAVAQGVAHWDTAQWYTLAQDTTRLGVHNGPTGLTPCVVAALDTTAQFVPTSATFTGVNGNYNLNIELNLTHTDSMTVDVQLASGNAAWINNYTTQTVSFPNGSIQKTLALTITNDTTGGVTHTVTFKLVNPTGGLLVGADSVFTLTLQPPVPVAADTCATLFFSEYVEGSANNKALEIYNPTSNAIDLSGYKVQLYINGNTTPNTTFNLSGTIAIGDVYVIVANQADSILKLTKDTTSAVTNFNGNDAVALLYNTDTLDVIGVIGTDPGGAGWPVGGGTTNNHTLVRDPSVKKGNSNWSVAVNQWASFAQDTFFLGSHNGPDNQNACGLVSSVSEVAKNIARVYPNPNNGNFVIELNQNFNGIAEVKLFDLAGRVVYASKENSNIINVSTNGLNAGMYLLETQTGNTVSRTKLTIQ